MRTCIGCRASTNWQLLERIVLVEVGGSYAVEFDHKRRRQGRGAWLHPDPDCREKAIRRRAFGRAFRVTKPVDFASLLSS